ncbi:hypothetical protein I2486_17075 [Cellulophaga sp. E16_2]|uniref:hypothetical protein n=1 Tax=Cellulophaga sp. E16_2 TaxID=2789297 RepID=UPI001A91B806|nr:hypothetical protein [Cellulophaga sp. E16_2]MBO0593117.1 hypothetical protein [Cellulophaga sp. E16_2]
MNSIKIQETLIEIEGNLRQLESARNQVLSVTNGSYELSEKVLHLISNFQKLNDNLSEENNTIIEQLRKHNSAFKERVTVITDNIDVSVSALVDKINTSSSRFSSNLDDVSLKHKSSSEQLISDKEKVLNSIIDKHQALSKEIVKIENQLSTLDFHKQTEKIINQLDVLQNASSSIEKRANEIKETLVVTENNIIKRFDEESAKQDKNIEIVNELVMKGQKKQLMYFVVTLVLVSVFSILIYLK